MNDRELLELAAKAAGVEPFDWDSFPLLMVGDGPDYWNPLTDDGDALRLAVKLGQMHGVIVRVGAAGASCEVPHQTIWSQGVGTNSCIGAETRRAIVQAAAVIGKQANTGIERLPAATVGQAKVRPGSPLE